ncbi:MAG: 3-methyl-2-oxobutanoate hydroxymethyltransferase [Proteobacteria bacterium]|nr:MAG: 3-methyl-2-oxobutanoate hydroxymethyltransferase [Pseudomonadota bacterium]
MSILKDKKQTINSIQDKKNVEKITMITAYDTLFAKIFDESVDMILVGDSLSMSFGGDDDTLKISLEEMIYHTKAVCKGAKNALIVFDMPFGTYTNKEKALKNAIKVYKNTKAHAIKIEGGEDKAEIIKHLTQNGIAVVAHIGLLPQNVRSEGGYKVKGRNESEAKQLKKDAKAVEKAGAFCVVLEGIKSQVATQISKSLQVPTIGIGAGNGTDGQVLVWSDAFGFFEDFKPKFAKRYLEGGRLVRDALNSYIKEVKDGTFPDAKHSY